MARHGLTSTTAMVALMTMTSMAAAQSAAQSAGTGVPPAAGPAKASASAVPDDAATAAGPRTHSDPGVTLFNPGTLAERGLVSTRDLLEYVPNSVGASFPGIGSGNIDYIRGLGTTSAAPSVDAPVATSIDGVFLPRQSAANFGFFDLSSIAVRRGPQGTTGGRETSGGTIDVRLTEPGDRLAGYFEGGYGAYQRREFRGSLDIPFGTGFAVKLSGYYQDDHGYGINSTTGQRNNDDNGAGLRGAFRLDVTDRLSWNGAVAYIRSDGENILNFDCDPRNPANCKGRFLTSGLRQNYDDAHPSPFVALGVTGRKANFGLRSFADTVLTTSTIRYTTDAFTLAFITGNVDLKQKSGIDFADGRAQPGIAAPFPAVTGYAPGGFTTLTDASSHQFSQEIRLDGKAFGGFIDYVAGAYYSDEGDTTDIADILATSAQSGQPALLADRTLRTTTRSVAGYAQADVNLSDALKLTGGVRYTDETKTFHVFDNRPGCQRAVLAATCLADANLTSGGAVIPTRQTARLFTPRAAISYQLPGVLVFASATRGFTSGGWNTQATAPNALLPFAAARNWTYEGGVKTALFGDRLHVNATGFYIDASRVAVAASGVDPASGAIGYTTSSDAGLHNYGAEVEATASPVKGLNLFANLGYQHARYRVGGALGTGPFGVKTTGQQQLDCRAELAARQVPGAASGNAADCATGIVDASGNLARPVYTPDYSAAVGGTFDYAIPAAGIILQPGGSVIYRSSFETGAANASLYSGAVTGPTGVAYLANPFGTSLINGSRAKSYVLVNAALALKTDDNNWVLSVECNNCLDRNYVASSLGANAYLAPPRTWLVHAKRTF